MCNFSTLEIKKPRVSGKKKTIPQDGVVENSSVFGQLLKTAGITLKAGENQNEIGIVSLLPCASLVDGISISYAKRKYKLQMDIVKSDVSLTNNCCIYSWISRGPVLNLQSCNLL